MKCPIDDGKILSCPQDLNHPPMSCSDNEWKKEKDMKMVLNEEVDSRDQYCIGYSWPNREDEWYEGLQLTRYGCSKPCNGETPCLR